MNIPVGVYPNRDASELRVVLKLFDMVFAAAQLEVKPVQHHRYRETDLHVVAQQDVFQAAEQLVGDFAEPAVGEHAVALADAPGDERALCGDTQGAAAPTAGKAAHRHDIIMRRPAEGGAQDDVVALQQGCAASGMTSCKRQPRVVIALLQLSSRLSSLPTNSAACGLRYTSLKWVDIPAIPPCEMGCHRDRGKSCDWPRVQVEGIGVTMWGAATKRSTRAAPCGAGAIRRVMGEADLKLPRHSDPVVPRNRVEVFIYPCG